MLVALSGGVDSSVAAWRLVKEGHEVGGVFLKLMQGDGSGCCNLRSAEAARAVATELGIPFFALDYADAFQKGVIEPALKGLREGMTPSPCADCNGVVKFGALLEQARRMGVEQLATGHYARREEGKSGVELHEAANTKKDQTWFLWSTPKPALEKILFPLGRDISKGDVRQEAARVGLPTAETPESQDLCFAPQGITALLEENEGEVLDLEGLVVGKHRGQHTVTLGQRRGLGVALGQPVYAVGKNAQKNTVTVGPYGAGARNEVPLTSVNLISRCRGGGLEARIRHRGKRHKVEEFDGTTVRFTQPIVVAPGQSVVIYKGTRVVGGGCAG